MDPDEPTSGLDSQTAWSICKLLRKLAENGQAILCTIHQPSALLFQTFDQLRLLGNGGTPLYFGDIGPESSVVSQYFESHGARACRRGENPADWLLEITGNVAYSESNISWSDTWKSSSERNEVKNHLQRINEELSALPAKKDAKSIKQYAAPFLTQLWVVMSRNFQQDWRTPEYLYSKILLSSGTVSPFLTFPLTFLNGDFKPGLLHRLFVLVTVTQHSRHTKSDILRLSLDDNF